MDDKDREKIEKLVADRKRAHTFLSKNSPVYNSFIDLENQTYMDRNLEKKYKLLIGIAISIIKNCESCLEWHISEALNSGATKEQILEAIEVSYKMGGGPSIVSSRFALKIMEYYNV